MYVLGVLWYDMILDGLGVEIKKVRKRLLDRYIINNRLNFRL